MLHPARSPNEVCQSGILERPRYFPRQLITPTELTLEQTYFRDKLRRHNRFLHGWGVVCGAQVCLVPKADKSGAEPWKVQIEPAYILGPYGDEIIIETQRIADLRTGGVTSRPGDPAGELTDPWCSPVYVARPPGWVYVAIKYAEVMTRPVRAQPVGCGCDDMQCEYSRFCDGYEIGVLPECPASHHNPPTLDSLANLAKGALSDCAPCPSDPWVVLAAVKLNANGTITEIDNCSCRRMVLSFAHVWWQCEGGKITIETITVMVGDHEVAEVEQGQTNVSIKVTGSNFRSEGDTMPAVNFGSGVMVGTITASPEGNELTVQVNIDPAAILGPRTMTITNLDCSMASHPEAIKITARAPERAPLPPVEPRPEGVSPAPPTPPEREQESPARRPRRRGER
jgi:hypothetical protein